MMVEQLRAKQREIARLTRQGKAHANKLIVNKATDNLKFFLDGCHYTTTNPVRKTEFNSF